MKEGKDFSIKQLMMGGNQKDVDPVEDEKVEPKKEEEKLNFNGKLCQSCWNCDAYYGCIVRRCIYERGNKSKK